MKHKLIPYRPLSKQLFLLLGQRGGVAGLVKEEKSQGDKELNYIPATADPSRHDDRYNWITIRRPRSHTMKMCQMKQQQGVYDDRLGFGVTTSTTRLKRLTQR